MQRLRSRESNQISSSSHVFPKLSYHWVHWVFIKAAMRAQPMATRLWHRQSQPHPKISQFAFASSWELARKSTALPETVGAAQVSLSSSKELVIPRQKNQRISLNISCVPINILARKALNMILTPANKKITRPIGGGLGAKGCNINVNSTSSHNILRQQLGLCKVDK